MWVCVKNKGVLKEFVGGLRVFWLERIGRDCGWKGLEESIVSIVRVGRCVEHP